MSRLADKVGIPVEFPRRQCNSQRHRVLIGFKRRGGPGGGARGSRLLWGRPAQYRALSRDAGTIAGCAGPQRLANAAPGRRAQAGQRAGGPRRDRGKIKRYRNKADELRAVADQTDADRARGRLRIAADNYNNLADMLERSLGEAPVTGG